MVNLSSVSLLSLKVWHGCGPYVQWNAAFPGLSGAAIPVHLRAQEYRPPPAAAEVLRIPRQICFQGPLAKRNQIAMVLIDENVGEWAEFNLHIYAT